MKVLVDREICEAQGVCVRLCPDVFNLDDEDILHIAEGDVPKNNIEQVQHAVKRCPRQALSVEE